MPLFNELAHGLSHLLFPRLCEGCSQALMKLEDILCLQCLQELPHTNYHLVQNNEAAMRFAGRIPYVHVTALSAFTPDGLLQHLLHGLKYKNKPQIGHFLGRQLGYDLQKSVWGNTIDKIIPVPLHPKKEESRGYNQSNIIGAGLGEILQKELSTNTLQRTRFTDSQTTKTRAERLANMQGAFVVKNESVLRQQHVLLIDDVLTTGATLEAAANALLTVPGLSLSIATIGIADG